LQCRGIAPIIWLIVTTGNPFKAGRALLLCAAAALSAAAGTGTAAARTAAAAAGARAVKARMDSVSETFFIPANSSGSEATIKLPVGAVSSFTASYAEALTDYAGPEIEAMRLSGDVRIDVIGTGKPVQIRADRVVLELTADRVVHRKGSLPQAGSRQLRSRRVIDDGDATQTFVGNVIYTLQTASGAVQIKADRLEHTERMGARMEPRAGV
jgi:hypothetical protein